MIWWFLIVIVVIGFLVFISIKINRPIGPGMDPNAKINQETMQNTQQVEGVKITILKEGTGDVAKTGDTVAMNYTGRLADGTVFDSNVDPKFKHVEPFIFTIGAGQVIKGWDQGLVGMKVGGKRKLTIPASLAYGDRSPSPAIPANSTLVFEVELLKIEVK